jgi:hypothetical protein
MFGSGSSNLGLIFFSFFGPGPYGAWGVDARTQHNAAIPTLPFQWSFLAAHHVPQRHCSDDKPGGFFIYDGVGRHVIRTGSWAISTIIMM